MRPPPIHHLLLLCLALAPPALAQTDLLAGRMNWKLGRPVLYPLDRAGDHYYSVKDPSIVRYRDRWHLFCTIRGTKRSHQIEYISFNDWGDTAGGERHMLKLSDGYFCAPQVFYFTPHKRWYLIYQVIDQSRKPALQPAWSTNTDISDPASWTRPELLFAGQPANVDRWIDFWVICDDSRAHLFFTSLNGLMWRAETPLSRFPEGWGKPRVVLKDDIYEASNTYRLKGLDKYLTVVEAQGEGGRRYYRAYLADRLDGEWKLLSPNFAVPANVGFTAEQWTDSFSHGELLRDGYDQTLTLDPANPRLLFQGATDEARQDKPYGQIPWRLGLLEPH